MYKKGSKILASLIVIIMLLANIGPASMLIGEVLAADLEMNKQDSKTNNDNVSFNSYFVEENNQTHEIVKRIGEENSVVAEISVKDSGYLKDARIDFVDSNFLISDAVQSESIAKVDKNQIVLNQINAGDDIKLELPFSFKQEEKIYADQFNKVSQAKFAAVYVDGNGNTHNITKDINLCLKWTANAEAEITSEIIKYVPYTVGNKTGLIMQMLVKEDVKNNVLPVKESNIEIQNIEINGVKPSSVSVYSKENIEYKVDEKTQNLLIKYKNEPNEQNQVNWNKEAVREYTVTYIYPQTAIVQETTLNINAKLNTKVYSHEDQEIKANINNQYILKEKVGDIVDFKINTPNTVSKGYMFANYDREQKLETPFSEKVITNISMPDLVDTITIKMQKDTFTNETQFGTANSYYKNVKISNSKIKEFFGEEGTISIFNEQGLIKTIDKTIEDENIIIETNSDEIAIVTSKPIKEGEFTLEFDKAIRGDVIYSEEQLSSLKNIISPVTIEAKSAETIITQKTLEASTNLADTALQAELYMNNNNLSTVVTNENVEFRAVLKTNSEYNKLYKNPIIVLNMPEYVESINPKTIQVLFDEELTFKACNVVGKSIVIELEGIQTNYNINSVYGGTNIIFTADIKTNILTPNKADVITMQVISNEEQLQINKDINFVAPSGVVAVNKISNFVVGQELMALTKNEKALIEVETDAKVATEEIQVINNYNNRIENIAILGRTLTTDTTNPLTNAPLENNLNIPMIGAVNTNGLENVVVYYSSNGSATRDLNNPQNGWTLEVQDFSQVKSYLIVVNNSVLNVGESLKFSYDMLIPGNLQYSLNTSALYTVFFDNVQETQILVGDNVTSPVAGLTTGEAPNLEVTLKSNIPENSIVTTKNYITYTVSIKNTSSFDAENVYINVTAPKLEDKFETKFATYSTSGYGNGFSVSEETEKSLSIEVGTIKPGEEIKKDFIIYLDSVTLEKDEIVPLNVTAGVIANKMQKEKVVSYSLKVQESLISTSVVSNYTESAVLTKGDELEYTISINKYNTRKIEDDEKDTIFKNIVTKIELPKGIIIKDATIEGIDSKEGLNIDNNKNVIEYTINNMESTDKIELTVKVEIGDALGVISPIVTTTTNNKTIYATTIKNIVEKLDIKIEQLKLDNSYIKEDEKITFTYVITNNSNVNDKYFTIENYVPDGVTKEVSILYINGSVQSSDKSIAENNKVSFTRSIDANSSITAKVTFTADRFKNNETQKTITNFAKILVDDVEIAESNKVTAVIEYNSHLIREDENGNTIPRTNDPIDPSIKGIISGIAWLDKNQDGERNDNEEAFPELEVRLLNKNTNEVIATTRTLSNGEYSFTGLDSGDYIVIVLYNSAKYDLTQYKKSGVSLSVNSDFIDVKMNIDDTEKIVAASDTIRIASSNARNIDIGLCDSVKSDLKLDKYISSITVSCGNNVNTYNYNNSKLAKVEIAANELSSSTVIVEYKIVVTNEGAIGNYVKKVVDYIPSGMKFNSELNRDWYQSTNGDIYNSSLANVKLQSGESKELTLTLTKQMTDDNTGIVNNNAELFEVYNEEATLDKDSTPANKVSGEDDMSNADVIISVKTGDAVLYTLIISVTILIGLAVGIYFVRRQIIKRI